MARRDRRNVEDPTYVWTNAIDGRGIVHRVVSLAGFRHCGARCGLDGMLREAIRSFTELTWTDEDVSCMTCIVKEARLATT